MNNKIAFSRTLFACAERLRRENVCPHIQIASESGFWAREDGLKGRRCYNSVITKFRAIRKTAFQVKQKETPGSVKTAERFVFG